VTATTKAKPTRTARKKTAKKVKKTAKKKVKKTAKKGEKFPTLDERRRKIRDRYDNPCVIYEDDVEPARPATRFAYLNRLLGGGIKRFAIIEVYGWEDSGKTSMSLAMAADIQSRAPEGYNHVVMVNFEMPQDYEWWRTLGLRTDSAHFTQLRPRSLEEGIGDMADLLESGEVCCVVIDSVYAANSKDSKKMLKTWQDPTKGGQEGRGGIGTEARQWGAAWTAVKGLFVEHDAICIAVNQLREKPMDGGGKKKGKKSFTGPATTTPRGHALKFYSWVRLELKGSVLTEEDGSMRRDVDGRQIRVRIVKNKTSKDQRGYAWYDLVRGFGFDMTAELINLATEGGIIHHKGGGHYTCGKRKIRGKAALREWIEGSDKVRRVLRTCVDKYLAKVEVDDEETWDVESEFLEVQE